MINLSEEITVLLHPQSGLYTFMTTWHKKKLMYLPHSPSISNGILHVHAYPISLSGLLHVVDKDRGPPHDITSLIKPSMTRPSRYLSLFQLRTCIPKCCKRILFSWNYCSSWVLWWDPCATVPCRCCNLADMGLVFVRASVNQGGIVTIVKSVRTSAHEDLVGTFFIFPYIGNNYPNRLIFFRGVETTNQFKSSGSRPNQMERLTDSASGRSLREFLRYIKTLMQTWRYAPDTIR